jgi:hypothetical protein
VENLAIEPHNRSPPRDVKRLAQEPAETLQ